MTRERKDMVGRIIFSWLLDHDQELVLSIKEKAEKIAQERGVDEEEIGLFLDPWAKHALKDTSH